MAIEYIEYIEYIDIDPLLTKFGLDKPALLGSFSRLNSCSFLPATRSFSFLAVILSVALVATWRPVLKPILTRPGQCLTRELHACGSRGDSVGS